MKKFYETPKIDVKYLTQENLLLSNSGVTATAEDVTESEGSWE